MKPGDFFIDLQDLLGRIGPGLITIVCVYLLIDYYQDMSSFKSLFDSALEKYSFPAYFGIVFIAYFVGDINAFLAFRIRDFYTKYINAHPSLSIFLKQFDKSGILLGFFENHFSIDHLKQNYRELHFFCKKSFADGMPVSYPRVKKIEAAIHFKFCMILPIILISLNLFIYKYLFLGLVILLLIPLLFYTGLRLTKLETHLIYICFYNHIKNDIFKNQTQIPSKPS